MSGVPAPRPFDVCGPLPVPGVTLLEASAGTGKTYTIAALVARFVVEGVPLSEILAVTFTRMATGELRDRVRERLVSAHRALDRFVEHGATVSAADDPVAVLFTDGSADDVRRRRRRLAQALASFDEATITTTHGFCQLVLASMGVSGGAAPGDALLEDTSELVDEVVDDLYLQRSLRHGAPAFARRIALAVAKEAVRNPDTPLEPPPDDSVPGRLRRFAEAARRELARRLKEAQLLTFDDLLCRLRDTLADDERGPAACGRLAGRFRVVLVDEFQDTDPVQWEIVCRAFGQGQTVLVLIGDPKQAIYAFRGADVYAYLEASAVAQHHLTLGDNYRSDAGLLRALDALLHPTLLGHPAIPYRQVRATPAHVRSGLEGAPSPAALRVRVVHDGQRGLSHTKTGLIQKDAAVDWVARDVAGDVVELLSSGAELVEWDRQGAEQRRRPLSTEDVAVLVRTNRQASVVDEALRAAGVASVVASSTSIFATEAAGDWLALLEAIEQPASRARAAAVALGPFVGMTARQLAEAGDDELEELTFRLHRFGDVLRRRGIASLYRRASADGGVPGRLLGQVGGERRLTDLGHVAEVLGAEAAASRLGPSRLRAWLARRMAEGAHDESEERTRRLDSDAEAVQVLTVHRSKGLEFPVVYCPYLWDATIRSGSGQPVVYHDPQAGDRRVLDVGTGTTAPTPVYEDHARAWLEEERGEQLRHLYVALTRAKHQVVLSWARADKCQRSPLGRLLFGRDAAGNVTTAGDNKAPLDTKVIARLEELAAGAGGTFVVERATGQSARGLPEGSSDPDELSAASFTRRVDQLWRRSSYSAITAGAHDALVGSEPETRGTLDEPAGAHGAADGAGNPGPAGTPVTGASVAFGDGAPDVGAPEPPAQACPLDTMPAGAAVGTVVHRVLERVDFAAADLDSALAEALRLEEARHGAVLGPSAPVVAGLAAALRSPLGPLAGDARLCDLARTDRLDELAFEFPVAGGDHSSGAVPMDDLAAVLGRHEEADGPLRGYAARLADPALERQVRGYLSGSIDLVFRLTAAGDARYFVVDYKTNRLAPPVEPLSAWHYRPEALRAEMLRLHYPLQALLYDVALHRYLRWRLAGYDPDRHLGGVLYLFLRGMFGPDTPRLQGEPCGVFSWRPPAGLVSELSDVLDAGGAGEGRRAS